MLTSSLATSLATVRLVATTKDFHDAANDAEGKEALARVLIQREVDESRVNLLQDLGVCVMQKLEQRRKQTLALLHQQREAIDGARQTGE